MKDLDQIVHEKSRLAILTTLRTRPSISFRELKHLTQLTDGMLSVQTQNLEKAEYITIIKAFLGRKPFTTYKMTKRGERAFDKYLREMEALIAQIHRQQEENTENA